MKRSMLSWSTPILAALVSQAALAADLVITNARVFTATDAGLIESASVHIAGNRIESVSTAEIDASRDGARVIDAGGKTVLPGLIDAHYHAFFDEDGASFPKNDAEAQAYVAGQMPGKLHASLQHGFTSLISPIDFWPFIADVRDKVVAGEIEGPRLFVGGRVFMAPGDHYVCGTLAWCNEHLAVQIATADEARSGVARYADNGVDFITYDSRTNVGANGPMADVVMALIDEAHDRDLRVMVHGVNALYLQSLMDWGIDGLFQQADTTRDDDGSLLAGAASERIPVGITSRIIELTHHNVMTLLNGGAVPIFASDMPGAGPEEILPRMLRLLSEEFGLSNEEILRAATSNAAQVLLGESELGTIEAGQLADIIIVDGDPLTDLSALLDVEMVIKDGKVVLNEL